jgi:hypothetical protein
VDGLFVEQKNMSTVDEQILAQEALQVLWNDLGDTRRAVQENPNDPRLRRHLFHDFCVYMEASVASTKRTVVILDKLLRDGCFNSTNREAISELSQLFDFQIEKEVISLLAGKQAEVSQNGQPRIKERFIPRLQDVRFAYSMFARALRLDLKPDFSSDGWSAFTDVVKRRNRITHPIHLEDLVITDADTLRLGRANEWFTEDLLPLMKAGTARMEQIKDVTERLFEEAQQARSSNGG